MKTSSPFHLVFYRVIVYRFNNCIYHFHTLDQRDLPVYISHINLWSGIPYSGLFSKQKFSQEKQNLNFEE